MELRGLNGVIPIRSFPIWLVFIFAALSDICFALVPTLTLSQTNLTIREDGTLELRCDVDRSIGTEFRWVHNHIGRSAMNITTYYNKMSSKVRVNVTETDSTHSFLQIRNISVADSGVIGCEYLYPDGQGSKVARTHTTLCVSQEPGSPDCFTTEPHARAVELLCITTDMALCYDDITLTIRLAANGMVIQGSRKESVIETRANISKEHIINDGYICTLQSNLFPSVETNCSFDLPKITTAPTTALPTVTDITTAPTTTLPTETETVTNRIFKSTTVTATAKKNKAVTFSLKEVIIAASAAGGGVLFLTIFICVIIACCKRCNKSDEKFGEEIDMHERNSEPQSKGNLQISDNVLQKPHQNGEPGNGSMPRYAKPDKNGLKCKGQEYETVPETAPSYYTINNETPDSAIYSSADNADETNLRYYSSVPQSSKENHGSDGDREKIQTPTLSPHEYAYASFDLPGGAPAAEDTAVLTSYQDPQENLVGPEEGGFVDNSIYEPS